MGKRKVLTEQMNTIMEEFDWEHVQDIMKATSWRWHEEGVPSLSSIMKTARRMMESAIKEKNAVVSTGGFTVLIRKWKDNKGCKHICMELFFGVDSMVTEFETKYKESPCV
jgi:shikimate kinase